jgi:hypothetical protein
MDIYSHGLQTGESNVYISKPKKCDDTKGKAHHSISQSSFFFEMRERLVDIY